MFSGAVSRHGRQIVPDIACRSALGAKDALEGNVSCQTGFPGPRDASKFTPRPTGLTHAGLSPSDRAKKRLLQHKLGGTVAAVITPAARAARPASLESSLKPAQREQPWSQSHLSPKQPGVSGPSRHSAARPHGKLDRDAIKTRGIFSEQLAAVAEREIRHRPLKLAVEIVPAALKAVDGKI